MPVYNTERYLDRGIQSVLNQTFQDWELILVNDGSTDGSLAICEKYAAADARITIISQENQGAGAARNAGIDVAQGTYIAFPDSDDWLEPTAYEICMNKLDQCPVDLLLFGEITSIYDDATETITKEIHDPIRACYYGTQEECRKQWPEMFQDFHINAPWNKIYKASVIKENHVRFPDLRRMQDGVFNLYFYNCITSFSAIEEYLYHFIWHSTETQKKKLKQGFINCALTYYNTAMEFIKAWGVAELQYQKKLGAWLSETLIMAEFVFLPMDGASFKSIYRHVKSINRHPGVIQFYRSYAPISGGLRKKELAMKNNWNFLIALAIFMNKR